VCNNLSGSNFTFAHCRHRQTKRKRMIQDFEQEYTSLQGKVRELQEYL
jgi:hypothetical protein